MTIGAYLRLSLNVRYKEAFNRSVAEINTLATYQLLEESIYNILCTFSYP